MDITLIQSAITSLKSAAEIANGMMQLKSLGDVQGKVIELQGAILTAQSSALAANGEQAAMLEKIRSLGEELARAKAWEEQRQRYALTSILGGAGFVYSLRGDKSNGEPPHFICAKCYEDSERRILQQASERGFPYWFCPKCDTRLQSHTRSIDMPAYAEAKNG